MGVVGLHAKLGVGVLLEEVVQVVQVGLRTRWHRRRLRPEYLQGCERGILSSIVRLHSTQKRKWCLRMECGACPLRPSCGSTGMLRV